MNKFIEWIKSIKKSTIVRTIIQFLAYVNQIVAVFGMTSFASSPVYQWISFGVTLVITVINYWYNNDFTSNAKMAGSLFDMLKDGKITKEEAEEFINKYKTLTDISKEIEDNTVDKK